MAYVQNLIDSCFPILLLLAPALEAQSPKNSLKKYSNGAQVAPIARPNGIDRSDLLGYRSTRWGMTVDELVQALPNELLLIVPPKDAGDMLIVGEAITKKIYIAGVELNLIFKTTKVASGLAEVSMSTDQAGKREFVILESTISEKYGTPTNKQESKSLMETIWVFKTTTIKLKLSLTYIYSDFISSILSISYSPTAKGDGDKL